jgi:hypothetical protein
LSLRFLHEITNMVTLLALSLGAFAVVTTIPTLILIISFATILREATLAMNIPATVASIFGVIGLAAMIWLLYRQLRQRNHSDDQIMETRQKQQDLLTEVTGLLCFLYATFSLATLVWMQIRSADLPRTIFGNTSKTLLAATFVLWAFSSLAQCAFLVVLLRVSRLTQQTHSLRPDEEPHRPAEMQQASRPMTAPSSSRGRESSDEQSFSSKSRKRWGSDTMSSIRSSVTHVVRPISSKTRLVSLSKPYRPTSLDSGTGEREIVEDGFDSWDLSAVDPHSRHFVMSAANSTNTSSSNNGRFLETIPASPTGSRSPSPGFPLDLEPPPRRRRSRSHSPATTIIAKRRDSASSPTGSEAHIHPLFRTDSPTPPPSATPGTVVTAAPGAGQAIIDRQSVRRMRSGSLPNSPSPLGTSRSLDDIPSTVKDDYENGRPPSPPEREMTPPIPDWILGAGPRNSLTGYSRRKGLVGLDPLGEGKES